MDDFINGSFELAGALMLLFNIRQLMRDKCVRGCDWKPVVFFTLWGIWNLYYYPSLGQWCSFAGGCAIATVNAIWLWLVAYYSLRSSVAAETPTESLPALGSSHSTQQTCMFLLCASSIIAVLETGFPAGS